MRLKSFYPAVMIFLLIVIGMTSCSKNGTENLQNPVNPDSDRMTQTVDVYNLGSGQSCVILYAGQTINAGTVCFDDIDTDNDYVVDTLAVTYTTINGWELVNANFWIGNSLVEMPVNKSGNPIPGQFPYKSGDITGATIYTFNIPFSAFGFTCPGPEDYYVAANATVRKPTGTGGYQTEGAWGNGTRIVEKGPWAMYFMIYITCDIIPPPVTACKTAFAYGGQYAHCFIDYEEDPNSNNWGWTNGPLSEGSYVFDLYAGAGQCILANGTRVGTLTVMYSNGTATVTYQTSGIDPDTRVPYTLEAVHLYVGNDEFPTVCTGPPKDPDCHFTTAPGQYPYKAEDLNGATSYQFVITGLSGTIYVIAHADVCGFPEPGQ